MAEAAPERLPDAPLPPGQRLALRVEYDGGPYAGWQAQPQLPAVCTVQETVEAALSRIAAAPVRVHCAGRTDTGVHAIAQWVHLDTPAARGLKAWVVGGNAQLPPSVRLTAAVPVAADFHARHSALRRRYDYLIANRAVAPALLAGRALWVREPLDAGAMQRALQPLLGEHDFSAFRAAACQSRSPMRHLALARAWRRGDCLQVCLVGNAFLHHMVRNIVGSLLEVGAGRQHERWLGELLAGRDRRRAAATAGPEGLYLSAVEFPARYRLPAPQYPPFLAAEPGG